MLDFALSPEQVEIQRQARAFALKEILPVAAYYDESNILPRDIMTKAFEAGLLNPGIPKQYGGSGLGVIEEVLITEELAAACLGFATSVSDNGLGAGPIILSNRENIKKKYLTRIAKEPKLICFATSEPTMGSDVAGMRCLAEKK
jgi:acyl-CoA dehydrogenase